MCLQYAFWFTLYGYNTIELHIMPDHQVNDLQGRHCSFHIKYQHWRAPRWLTVAFAYIPIESIGELQTEIIAATKLQTNTIELLIHSVTFCILRAPAIQAMFVYVCVCDVLCLNFLFVHFMPSCSDALCRMAVTDSAFSFVGCAYGIINAHAHVYMYIHVYVCIIYGILCVSSE